MKDFSKYYQVQKVGVDTIPPPNISPNRAYLVKLSKELEPGQSWRLIVPKGDSVSALITVWKRIGGEKAKGRQQQQADGTILVWLSFKNNEAK